jgi:hypothetical protein
MPNAKLEIEMASAAIAVKLAMMSSNAELRGRHKRRI